MITLTPMPEGPLDDKARRVAEAFRDAVMARVARSTPEGRGPEIKLWTVHHDPATRLTFVTLEVGMTGDEGSLASVFCRDYRHIAIGPKGGVKLLNPKGRNRPVRGVRPSHLLDNQVEGAMSREHVEKFLAERGYDNPSPGLWTLSRLERRYGQWAGNPGGRSEDEERCRASVPDGVSFIYRQCLKPRRPSGLCRQHERSDRPYVPPLEHRLRSYVLTDEGVFVSTTTGGVHLHEKGFARYEFISTPADGPYLKAPWRHHRGD